MNQDKNEIASGSAYNEQRAVYFALLEMNSENEAMRVV